MRGHFMDYAKIVVLVVFVAGVVVLSSLSFVQAYSIYEVKFRGTVATDKRQDAWFLHGMYHCIVTVDAIFHDPTTVLFVGSNVTVAYMYSLDLKVGEYVDCYGVKSGNYRLTDDSESLIVTCWPEPYYVRRTSLFSFLSLTFTLSFVAVPLVAIYLYRKRQHKRSLEQGLKN
jgi:hypothetical protein